MSKIPTSVFGRGTKLLGLAGKVALKELGSKVRLLENEKDKLLGRIELAQDVVKTLSEMKGASMKVGQLLSLDLGDFLPPEIVKVLEQLQKNSTFLPYAEIEGILKSELGERFTALEEISREPIAAASIGQVHRAKLNGKAVAIKIQYPGVAESIPSDLRMLELLLNKLLFFQRKTNINLEALLSEIQDVMMKEADYLYEKEMHELYRDRFRGSPYRIPELYPEFTTRKVLTQEFMEGLSFGEWLATNPDLPEKERIGDLLLRLYLDELFKAGLVQTDPNPGNFLITPHHQIALLDFGATRAYSDEFVRGYRDVLIQSYHGRKEKILEAAARLQLIDLRESDEVKEIFVEMMDFLVEPFRKNEAFDFSDKDFLNRSRILVLKLGAKSKYTPPPKELVFLHRKLGGVFTFLKRLDVKLELNRYWACVEVQSAQK